MNEAFHYMDARAIREQARRKEELPLLIGRGTGATVRREGTTWDGLVRRLSLPMVDNVTSDQYSQLTKAEKLNRKAAAGYYVPASCESKHRSDAEISDRWCCWVDVEGSNAPIEEVLYPLREVGLEVFWHTTRSHHPSQDRRYRLWLPSLDDLDDYAHSKLASKVCALLEQAGIGVDRKASIVYSQPAFQPVIGPDIPLEYGLVEGRWLGLDDLGDTWAGQCSDNPHTQTARNPSDLLIAAIADDAREERKAAAKTLPAGPLFGTLHMLGMVQGREAPGRWRVSCPNAHQHSDPTDDTAYYYEPHHGGFSGEGFKCFHSHCHHLDPLHVKLELGVRDDETEQREQASAAERLEPTWMPGRDSVVLEHRPWIVPGTIMKGYMSIVHAPGGMAKSTWALLQAASIAAGVDLTGRGLATKGLGAVPQGDGMRVWILNNEDDDAEMMRRLVALADHHNLDWTRLQANLATYSGYREPVVLATERRQEDGSMKVVATAWASALVREIRRNDIQLLVLDPVVSVHNLNENDNQSMNGLMAVLRRICDLTGVAMLLVAHDRKGGGSEAGGRNGGDSLRGASAVRDAARVTMQMGRMSEKEAEALGVDWEDEGRFWMRMDDGKKNFAPPAAHAEWYRLVGVDLGDGNEVATLERIADVEVRQRRERAVAQDETISVERKRSAAAQIMATAVEVLIEQGDEGVDAGDMTTPGGRHMSLTKLSEAVSARLHGTPWEMADRTVRTRLNECLTEDGRLWKGYEGRGVFRVWSIVVGRSTTVACAPTNEPEVVAFKE